MVSSHSPHFGEEDPLVGTGGSGTIFFTHCNLLCLFCQNFEISHLGEGQEIDAGALAGCMLALQRQGCHNINLVTPSHVVPQILAALEPAIDGGLSVPIVYNSSGYDGLDALRLLDGLSELVDDLTIERLPGATHWLAHEEPQRIASAIHAFCGAS